jgi:hypothetical protein
MGHGDGRDSEDGPTRIDAHLEAEEGRFQQQFMSSGQEHSGAGGGLGRGYSHSHSKEDSKERSSAASPPKPSRRQDKQDGVRARQQDLDRDLDREKVSFGLHDDSDEDEDEDDEDEGIEWVDAGRPSRVSSSDRSQAKEHTSAAPAAAAHGRDYYDEYGEGVGPEEGLHFYSSVYLPSGGIGVDFGGSVSGSEEEEEDEDESGFGGNDGSSSSSSGEDDYLARPDISPSELKARRLRKFSREIPAAEAMSMPLKAKQSSGDVSTAAATLHTPQRKAAHAQSKLPRRPRGVDSVGNSPEDKHMRRRAQGQMQAERDEDELSAELMALLGTVHVNRTVHVGVSLLSDDDDDDDDDATQESALATPQKKGRGAGSASSSTASTPSSGGKKRGPRIRTTVEVSQSSGSSGGGGMNTPFSPSATAWPHRE